MKSTQQKWDHHWLLFAGGGLAFEALGIQRRKQFVVHYQVKSHACLAFNSNERVAIKRQMKGVIHDDLREQRGRPVQAQFRRIGYGRTIVAGQLVREKNPPKVQLS